VLAVDRLLGDAEGAADLLPRPPLLAGPGEGGGGGGRDPPGAGAGARGRASGRTTSVRRDATARSPTAGSVLSTDSASFIASCALMAVNIR
jgi:hypothetical protein